jgi:polyferredoxin
VLTAAVAVATAYFAQDLIFYGFDTSSSAYKIYIQNSETASLAPLSFSYQGNAITLTKAAELADEDISLYALSPYGTAALDSDAMLNLNSQFLGSFAAVYPMLAFDYNGDGKDENVYLAAKTDLRAIQSNVSVTAMFRDKLLNLEVGIDNARALIVYFSTKLLIDRPVVVHFADGSSAEYITDAAGHIPGVSIKQIRKGITVEYAPNAKNVYLLKYSPERARIISSAILPIINAAALTAATILLCVLLRRLFRKRDPALKRVSFGGGFTRGEPRRRSTFMLIRWSVMLLSFFALVYGGTLLGFWFENITPPIFACGRYNPEQLTGSACYYLSHLNLLIDLPKEQIILFAASFFVPLVLFGRVLCGFVCPMGLVQDTLNATRQKTRTEGIALNERLYGRLATIKWVFVMLFLGMCFAGLDFCNICPALTLSPGFSGFKASVYAGGFVMLFAFVGSFFKRRFFCNICPLGLIMGVFYKISLFRLKKDCTACTECGACYEACPMGIKEIYTERENPNVSTVNCIMCGECIRRCPEDNALSMTFCGIKVYTASRDKFIAQHRRGKNDE